MYIKQLSVQNYRNFGEPSFIIELKPFTLILGENNIGKTNLLNALGLIFNQEIIIFKKRILEIDDINYSTVQAFKDQVTDTQIPSTDVEFPEVQVEVILTEMNSEQQSVVGDWFIDTALTEAKITYRFAPRVNFDKEEWITNQRSVLEQLSTTGPIEKSKFVDFPIQNYRYSLFGGDDPSNECDMYFLKMLKMEFLDALRDAQRELIASGDYRLLYRILNQKDQTQYEDIKIILSDLTTAVRKNPNLLSIKTEVTNLLDRVSLQVDEFDNSIDFNFSSPETAEVLKKLGLIYGANPISVERNGLGRNNLLYISLILSHLAQNDTAGGETKFRLISIEEPEAHLHPHLQDHLAKNIENIRSTSEETTQLILTSHSTHIAAKLNLANTTIVYRDQQNGSLDNHYVLSGLDPQQEKATINYLSKYLDATKSRMFFARRIILVEGISEQLLVPKFFEHYFGESIEKYNCNVINVNGVAFSHFLRVIRTGFFIRCLVLTDSDTGKQSENRANELKANFEQANLIQIAITSDTTFEKDIITANKSGAGKNILLAALQNTKPRSGKLFADNLGTSDINTESFFNEIEDYKAEFAFNLLTLLEDAPTGFVIPSYIRDGFDFMDLV